MTEQLLVTTAEAAKVLSVSVRTVGYLIASGELAPIVHIGRSMRIPTTTLRAFVEKRTADADTSAAQPSHDRSTRTG